MDRRQDLDGLRGVAIVLTVVLHYVCRLGYFPPFHPTFVYQLLDSFWSGVDVFFVLSGFLIGGIVLDNGRAPNFYRVFYLRRALRIVPVALLTIGFAYLVLPLVTTRFENTSDVPAYAYLLFINDFWTSNGARAYAPLGPMWSLAIEQQFYLVAPVILLYASARARLIGLIAIIVASPIIRSFDLAYSIWDFPFFRLDGLSVGVLAATLVRDVKFCDFVERHGRAASIAIAGAIGIALLFGTLRPSLVRLAWGIWLNSLAAGGAIVYLYFRPRSSAARILSLRPLVLAGRFSYFIYLMHIPVLLFVNALQGGTRTPDQLLLALVITVLAAWASWRLLESPLISIGKRFSYGADRPPPAALPATLGRALD